MAVCHAWTYKHITPVVFKSLQSLSKQQGFTIGHNPHGKFTIRFAGSCIDLAYAWDSRLGQLIVKCESKPMLMSCHMIKAYADRIICQSGGSVV